MDLPVVPADRVELAALTELEDLFAWAVFDFTFEVREEVVTVEMHLPVFAVGAVAKLGWVAKFSGGGHLIAHDDGLSWWVGLGRIRPRGVGTLAHMCHPLNG